MPTYTNLSILQGWLEIEAVSTVLIDRTPVPILYGWIFTTDRNGQDEISGERHPVMISGKTAQMVLEINRKINDKFHHFTNLGLIDVPSDNGLNASLIVNSSRPFVIAQGKLVSRDGHSQLDIRYLSLLGAPWGALEALEELVLDISEGTHKLVFHFDENERRHLSQVLNETIKTMATQRKQKEQVSEKLTG